ncbi:hypothetical protein PV779_22765 [Streptomyces sp. ID01-9D]|nr:hypothetical protein [Streptomyces sp. ID01-9D]
MARVVDEALLAGAAVVTPPAPRSVRTSAATAPSSATTSRAPGVGATASAATLGGSAGLGPTSVLALLTAVRLVRRFGR